MNKYLAQCELLSVTARMAIALLVFEQYCKLNRLDHVILREFSDFLWQWPIIQFPDQFDSWESSRPELVNFGLGDSASKELRQLLHSAQIDETDFRVIVGATVDILWGSFWGACDNVHSFEQLRRVITASKLDQLPELTPFKFSLFADKDGWGEHVTIEDCNYWRSSGKRA